MQIKVMKKWYRLEPIINFERKGVNIHINNMKTFKDKFKDGKDGKEIVCRRGGRRGGILKND